jgi:SAM-dependent methyltransferase
MSSQTDYVLGTHDEELSRLGIQHKAWRAAAQAAWKAAGIGSGQTVLDVGCGPGYATLDLAELVGPSGRVIAIDKSERFLSALESERGRRNLDQIEIVRSDLDNGDFPSAAADAAWGRWVFAFLRQPRQVLARVASVIRPGGVIVAHEYFDYGTWRPTRPCPEHERFVEAVMASWRDNGGEPNIALPLLDWLEALNFELRRVHPIIDIIEPGHPKWEWARSFLKVGRERLVELGYLTREQSESIWSAFLAFEATPGARMITPAVMEIIAVKRTGK